MNNKVYLANGQYFTTLKKARAEAASRNVHYPDKRPPKFKTKENQHAKRQD
jgi:hypothetical protein